MVGLADLWIPILVSSVLVFVASSLCWMVLPHHKADIKTLPDEDAFDAAIKPMNIKPGFYMYPGCHGKDVKSEEFIARYNSGPWGTLNVLGAKPNFGRNLLLCFVSYLVISAMVGYLVGIGTMPGAEYMDVFRGVGTAAILGYCMGSLAGDVFMGKPARYITTCFIDGVIFALITAGVFAWLWPEAARVIPTIP